MAFPVDVLGSVSHEALQQEAESYMTDLRHVSFDKAQSFTLSNHRKIRITLSSVGFVPIYGGDLKHRALALFAPEDQLTAVALLLAGQWWSVEDILTTSDPSRTGLIKVRSVVDRIVLYVLNRIVYRVSEMDKPEIPFLCHGQRDFAKILWKDGQAVGFYSVKPKDSLCNHFVTQCYQLPVMDAIFIRKCHRGNGHGLEMLEDFVDSFKEDQLGLKYPLSTPMYKVCSKYLSRYPADEDLLWVVEGVGGPYQRESVAGKLRTLRLKVSQPLATANGGHGLTALTGDLDSQTVEDAEQNSCLDITEDVIVVNKPLKLVEDLEETPVSTRTRSSGRKRDRDQTDEDPGENQAPKMSRLEDEDAEAATTATEEDGEGEEKEEACPGPVEAEEAVAPEPMEELAPEKQEAPALGVEEVNGVLMEEEEEKKKEEKKEEVEEKGGEEEDCREPETALENGAAEEDVEMEGGEEEEEEEKKEDNPIAIDTVDAAAVETPTPEEEPAEAPLTAPPAPEGVSLPGEEAEESGEEPPSSLEPATPQEPPAMEEEEEASLADSSGEAVLLVGVADLTYQSLEEEEEEGQQEEEKRGGEKGQVAEQEGKMEAEEEAGTTEDEEDREDVAGDVLGTGGGGGLAPKRKSKRRSQVPAEGGDSEATAVNEEEGEEEGEKKEKEEEEVKAMTTEDETHTGENTLIQEVEEEEGVEKEEEEEEEVDEEPPVVDQRALRRKSKPRKSPTKSKGKRRSKT